MVIPVFFKPAIVEVLWLLGFSARNPEGEGRIERILTSQQPSRQGEIFYGAGGGGDVTAILLGCIGVARVPVVGRRIWSRRALPGLRWLI
jgi:hypothetical protein